MIPQETLKEIRELFTGAIAAGDPVSFTGVMLLLYDEIEKDIESAQGKKASMKD